MHTAAKLKRSWKLNFGNHLKYNRFFTVQRQIPSTSLTKIHPGIVLEISIPATQVHREWQNQGDHFQDSIIFLTFLVFVSVTTSKICGWLLWNLREKNHFGTAKNPSHLGWFPNLSYLLILLSATATKITSQVSVSIKHQSDPSTEVQWRQFYLSLTFPQLFTIPPTFPSPITNSRLFHLFQISGHRAGNEQVNGGTNEKPSYLRYELSSVNCLLSDSSCDRRDSCDFIAEPTFTASSARDMASSNSYQNTTSHVMRSSFNGSYLSSCKVIF